MVDVQGIGKTALAAAWALSQAGRQDYLNWCQKFVENAYGTGGQYASAWAAREASAKRGTLYTNPEQAQVGDLVFFRPDPSNGNFGHVGIYVGGGKMISARNGGVGTDDITKGYWGNLRAGFAAPPAEWKGPTTTPDLVAGAQKLVSSVTTQEPGTLVAGWRQNMADVPEDVARRQESDAAAARAALPPQQRVLTDQLTEARRAMAQAQADVDRLRQAQAATNPATDVLTYNAVTAQLAAAEKRLADATGVKNTTESQLAGLQGAPAKAKRTQVVGNSLIDLDTGEVIATIPKDAEGKTPRTQVVNGRLINLDTGDTIATIPDAPRSATDQAKDELDLATARVNLQRAQQALDAANDPVARQRAQVELQQAQVALEAAQRNLNRSPGITSDGYYTPTDPATGRPLTDQSVRLPSSPKTFTAGNNVYPVDPETGLPDTSRGVRLPSDPKPTGDTQGDYAQAVAYWQRAARAKRDELLALQREGLDPQQAEQQFSSWWASELEPALAGPRMAAERAQFADQTAMDTAQRQENNRAEAINREREQYAYQEGQKQVDAIRPLLPQVRSAGFLSDMAANINNIGQFKPVQFNPESFNPAGYTAQMPNLQQMAEQASQRVLGAISPAVAAQVGRPLPALPQGPDLQQLLNGLRPPGIG